MCWVLEGSRDSKDRVANKRIILIIYNCSKLPLTLLTKSHEPSLGRYGMYGICVAYV